MEKLCWNLNTDTRNGVDLGIRQNGKEEVPDLFQFIIFKNTKDNLANQIKDFK